MKLNKVLGTFDCDLLDITGSCDQIQLLENNIIKYRYERFSDNHIAYYKVSVNQFEFNFKINLSQEPEFTKLILK